MKTWYKLFISFSLLLLLLCLSFGVIAAVSFFKDLYFPNMMSFEQARPFHVSAALFWILTAATGLIMYYKQELFGDAPMYHKLSPFYIGTWVFAVAAILLSYCFQQFGGREYWEFPPVWNLLLLVAWVYLLISFFGTLFRSGKEKPVYVWMWGTGLLFFLFTFTEQNLWHIAWFRESFLKEMTIQWKSNGSMVGAWNQMVYGLGLFLMVKISGDKEIARSKKAYFSYFLGLTNLIFNWGHHIYNIPTAGWVRGVSYTISMTEWVLVISIIQGFKSKLTEQRKFKHLLSYRLLIASEFWVFMNLLLALLMSVPAINRYTHGTHVTVAHAMGTTIGINTMILLASITFLFEADKEKKPAYRRNFAIGFWITQISLFAFWVFLIAAGLIKGMKMTASPSAPFTELMQNVYPVLKLFMYSGFVLFAGMSVLVIQLLSKAAGQLSTTDDSATN